MRVKIEHEHKCECIAKAPAMGEGRDFWVGKLTDKLPEHPEESYCLHMKTQFKDVTFLCNEADFQQIQILCMCITGKIDETWMESMIDRAKRLAP